MFCPKCGATNPSLTSKCSSCGSPLPIPLQTTANTSGMGNLSQAPLEIKGWNWGAFFLSWIWGVGNSVWIALLCLIPFVNWVMVFVLGAKGSEWAWAAKKWDSVEHFKRIQRNWALAGLIVFLVGLAFWIVYFVFAFWAVTTTEAML